MNSKEFPPKEIFTNIYRRTEDNYFFHFHAYETLKQTEYGRNLSNYLDTKKYILEEEHEAILAGVNNQLQACARQIDQFQSKLCEQDEALSVALEALECALPYVQRFGLGVTAQKIEEILTKENENEEIKSNDFME